ncbi:MAG: hypothetical protein FRX49_01418 [Trebouxia sp. A1-2]|nr:MAG: hypothetical protein FRX49_01418 [Trebouxia sp. A1-2]
MPQISKRFERRPIGRQIKREINGETEPGLVSGMYSMAAPEWRTVYTVRWKPVNEQEYDEHLALKTVQHYYKSDDTYANEPFVDEEIRLLQQYNWDERKCPKKGTPEFDKEILERFGNGSEGTGKSGSKSGKGRRANAKQSTAAAAAKAASRAADAVTTSTAAAKKQKSDKAATPSALARVSGPIRHIADAVNGTADKIKEVPQVLGQLISHALPSSSRKQSSDRPAISTGTNAAAQPLTDAAQKAQQAITAMSPAGASGTGKRASGTKQDAPPAKRVSRHATFAGPASAVVLDDQDEDIDIGGEAPHPHKNESSSGVVGSIAKIISTLSAAPSCQAQTSDHQGEDCDFEATGLQPAEQGNHGADSPTEADAALREEEDEEMVELAAGAEPQSIPKRVMMCKGDVPVDVHSAEDYEENEEYVVDSIVAQRGRGKNLQYMVKWKGYEMDPEAWTPRGNLKDTLALAHWEKALRGKGAAAGGEKEEVRPLTRQ